MHPYYFSSPSDPEFTIHCSRPGTCPIEGLRVRIPAKARPATAGDDHMVVLDQASGWEYDFFDVQNAPQPGGGTITIGWGGKTRIDGDGSGSPADMAATGLLGGIIREPELAAGAINHALFLATRCTSGKTVYPAQDAGGVCEDTTNAPASGQWFRLDLSDAEIARLDVEGWQKTILTALARYGGLIVDAGSNESISMQLESPQTFQSMGVANPWLRWASDRVAAGDRSVSEYDSGNGVTRYALDVANGLDASFWKTHLKVVEPCVIQRAC
jgi:hypothetical protein